MVFVSYINRGFRISGITCVKYNLGRSTCFTSLPVFFEPLLDCLCLCFVFYVFFPLPPAPPSGMKDENMENEGFVVLVGYIFLVVGFADFFGIFLCFAESAVVTK